MQDPPNWHQPPLVLWEVKLSSAFDRIMEQSTTPEASKYRAPRNEIVAEWHPGMIEKLVRENERRSPEGSLAWVCPVRSCQNIKPSTRKSNFSAHLSTHMNVKFARPCPHAECKSIKFTVIGGRTKHHEKKHPDCHAKHGRKVCPDAGPAAGETANNNNNTTTPEGSGSGEEDKDEDDMMMGDIVNGAITPSQVMEATGDPNQPLQAPFGDTRIPDEHIINGFTDEHGRVLEFVVADWTSSGY